MAEGWVSWLDLPCPFQSYHSDFYGTECGGLTSCPWDSQHLYDAIVIKTLEYSKLHLCEVLWRLPISKINGKPSWKSEVAPTPAVFSPPAGVGAISVVLPQHLCICQSDCLGLLPLPLNIL